MFLGHQEILNLNVYDIKAPLKSSKLLLPSLQCEQTWTDAFVIRSASLLNDSFFSLDQIRPSTN